MGSKEVLLGTLFTEGFLRGSIVDLDDWEALDDETLRSLESSIQAVFDRFPAAGNPNESQTEDDLIWPILGCLGWTASLRQQNLTVYGRENVPDGLLFGDDAAKGRANDFVEEWKRYRFGLAIVESKRWLRPLDRRSGRTGEETAPSTQMLRYLRRVDDLTDGALRWGILTNGACWRLYYQGARSVSEQFLEIDLAAVLGRPGYGDGLFAVEASERHHILKVFALAFRRRSFLRDVDGRTFHRRALDEGRFYEERVAASLSGLVFDKVFPDLVRAIAAVGPAAHGDDVREAALVLLYRLLFIFYAEDRDLLPIRDDRYDDYGLRNRVRRDVGRRKDQADTFSTTQARYWSAIDELCQAISAGDSSIGLPPYNGGLFDRERIPLLASVRLSDAVMAEVIDALSFEQTHAGRRYISYRDLGVQQLGSIYERLLEHEVVRTDNEVLLVPNIFARKGSGSYYTPDDLVGLIVDETIGPLVRARLEIFVRQAEHLPEPGPLQEIAALQRIDPAEQLLELRICDPAMGSGHFLVHLVDWLTDPVVEAIAEAEAVIAGYVSPLVDRINAIRETIWANAQSNGWSIARERLDDRHIVRRMVVKRCVYGVDKNPMAVELAKVALWLHTFTVGAPLSFLDHHLRCGDSLFGTWVNSGIAKATEYGSPLFLAESVSQATQSGVSMQHIERLTDVEIAEAQQSASIFDTVTRMTEQLNSILCLVHAFDWLDIHELEDKAAVQAFFTGMFGEPDQIIAGNSLNASGPHATEMAERFTKILASAQELVAEQRFLNWQVLFPGVWSDWESSERYGGFDAVIGNPPWDRMKLQQVEWFAARRREIAMTQRAAERKRLIAALKAERDPLATAFEKARQRAEAAARVARASGDYPLLSRGDINLYSLFVERALALVHADGVVGLLVPSGIASDKTSAEFFRRVSTRGRLRALYDFENRRTRYDAPPFFPDPDSRLKFCVFVAGVAPRDVPADCAFFLQDVSELDDPDRRFPLTAQDFARVNPNTGTAPVFRSRRAAELTNAIYRRLPVLVRRSPDGDQKAWSVKYANMFHMTDDSGQFRTRTELEELHGAYPVGGNRYQTQEGEWVPLYEGKMVQAFDHRAASVVVNPQNLHRPAQPVRTTAAQHRDPDWVPTPQFWVPALECAWPSGSGWILGFKHVTSPTNARSIIAALMPTVGFGNSLPILKPEANNRREWLLAANLNATILDFVARQKIQGQNLNLFLIEQLPVVPSECYENVHFGCKSAAEIVREAVLELTYTAHDMTAFARESRYLDETGLVKPPFLWDESRRMYLRAKLDALYFHLYGVTDRDDIRYIYSTFPRVKRQEEAVYGSYRSRDLCLAWTNALSAGVPDATIPI